MEQYVQVSFRIPILLIFRLITYKPFVLCQTQVEKCVGHISFDFCDTWTWYNHFGFTGTKEGNGNNGGKD